MKTVSGKVTSTTPISLSNAAKSLSKFAASDNHGASHAVSVYLQRAADSFNQLVKVHQKLNPNSLKVEDIVKNEDIPIGKDEIKNSSKIHIVKNEDIPVGSQENKKRKNLGKVENKNSSKIDVVKNEDIPIGSQEDKKSKNLGEEKKPKADTRNKIKNSESAKSNENELKNEDIPSGTLENKKSKNVGKEKIDKVKEQKLVKNEQRLDIGEGEVAKSNKNELEFVKTDSSLKTEHGVEEVKEDGMISKDKKKKKKKKKKNRGVGESEREVVKVEEDLGHEEEEERKKRKIIDTDADVNAGSAEQSRKKKSKRRRIEEHILTSVPPSVPWPMQSGGNTGVRFNQPRDARQGIQQAYESVSDGFSKSASALIRTPIKRYQRGAGMGSAFATAVQAALAAAIAPTSATARAVHCALLGVRKSLNPERKKESSEKYLGTSSPQQYM